MTLRIGIDIGNTRTKVFRLPDHAYTQDEGTLTDWALSPGDAAPEPQHVASTESLIQVVSVAPERTESVLAEWSATPQTAKVWTSANLPIANSYADDTTLGPDRPLAALAARAEFGAPVIVVDAGTALTVDLVTRNGVFAGGAIAPGLRTQEEALGEAGAMLHRVRGAAKPYPGPSTEDCLRIGTWEMFVGGLRRLVHKARAVEPEASLVVTGGDADVCLQILDDLGAVERPLLRIGLALLAWSEDPLDDA